MSDDRDLPYPLPEVFRLIYPGKFASSSDVQDFLNSMHCKGWDFIQAIDGYYTFKALPKKEDPHYGYLPNSAEGYIFLECGKCHGRTFRPGKKYHTCKDCGNQIKAYNESP